MCGRAWVETGDVRSTGRGRWRDCPLIYEVSAAAPRRILLALSHTIRPVDQHRSSSDDMRS